MRSIRRRNIALRVVVLFVATVQAIASATWGFEGNLCLCPDGGIVLEGRCDPEECCEAPEAEAPAGFTEAVLIAEGGCVDLQFTQGVKGVLAHRSAHTAAHTRIVTAATLSTPWKAHTQARCTGMQPPHAYLPPGNLSNRTTILLV